ncbi:hypothetical protein [Streptomyces collinus]|uniref:hypothetical protein n=1 Tax=Streptomyces collinus TaxID=42684 RepID=UPI0036E1146E
MDQGVAAAFAGVVGLVGAALGGLATAYGARIGANKSIEAVTLQVNRQSEVEHLHWLREQRRQACVSFIDAFLTVTKSVAACAQSHTASDDVYSDLLEALSNDHDALLMRREHLELWGPHELVDSARGITSATASMRDVLREWRTTHTDTEAMLGFAERLRDRKRDMTRSRTQFLTTAHRVLGKIT